MGQLQGLVAVVDALFELSVADIVQDLTVDGARVAVRRLADRRR
jgi:hypothetical protein